MSMPDDDAVNDSGTVVDQSRENRTSTVLEENRNEDKAVGSEQSADEAGVAKVDEKSAAPKEDWQTKRISRLTAEKRALEAENAALRASVVRAPGESGPEFERRVELAATQRSAIDDFNKQCNDAANAGRKEFPDFDHRIKQLSSTYDPENLDEGARYNNMVVAALATDAPHKIMHMLSSDLNEAVRIMNLPPIKMAVEIAKLSGRESGSVSRAPKPIVPIGGKGAAHTQISPDDSERSDNLSTAAWMARRNEQVKQGRRR